MSTQQSAAWERSLLQIKPHERVRIESVRFQTLRALCADLGILEGSTVFALAVTPRVLLLLNDAGQPVRLEAEWARFIRVTGVSATKASA
jgi:hypothetical protein